MWPIKWPRPSSPFKCLVNFIVYDCKDLHYFPTFVCWLSSLQALKFVDWIQLGFFFVIILAWIKYWRIYGAQTHSLQNNRHSNRNFNSQTTFKKNKNKKTSLCISFLINIFQVLIVFYMLTRHRWQQLFDRNMLFFFFIFIFLSLLYYRDIMRHILQFFFLIFVLFLSLPPSSSNNKIKHDPWGFFVLKDRLCL